MGLLAIVRFVMLNICCVRDMLISALSPLGELGNGIAGGEGAIYLWARLPKGEQLVIQQS